MQFLGTEGSLVLGGSGMTVAGEIHREGYSYSIDSWPRALQAEFFDSVRSRKECSENALVATTPPRAIW